MDVDRYRRDDGDIFLIPGDFLPSRARLRDFRHDSIHVLGCIGLRSPEPLGEGYFLWLGGASRKPKNLEVYVEALLREFGGVHRGFDSKFDRIPRRDSERPLRPPRAYVERALAAADLVSAKAPPPSSTVKEVLAYFLQKKTPELICQRTFFILAHLNFLSTIELARALRRHLRRHKAHLAHGVSFIIELLQMWQKFLSQKTLCILTKALDPHLKTVSCNSLKLLLLKVQAESAKPLPKYVKRLGTASPIGPSLETGSSVFNDFDPENILYRLVATELDLFRRITPGELLNQGWQLDDRWAKSPNVCALIAHYNNVTTWVASEILTTLKATRARRIKSIVIMLDMYINQTVCVC